ncbi:type IV secretory system conjugative DNA transfer family protein [Fluviibacterium sp. S390]|uniref:type IV secretory system conjugative DNA transfer family protein n=1 Tax=Fluviibacterium sp. S390 TaxID=3415139 RepID=UPI003C7B1A1F
MLRILPACALASAATLLADPAIAQAFGGYGGGFGSRLGGGIALGFGQALMNALFSLLAFGVGFLGVVLIKEYPRQIVWVLAGLAVIFSLVPGVGLIMTPIVVTIAFVVGIVMALARYIVIKPFKKPTTFGSAEWATPEDVERAGLTKGQGFFLGRFETGEDETTPLHYGGDRHLLTVAPTRAGKGVSAIIPNLLTYEGSVLVIDPKGENALITGAERARMGQTVMLVDPWDLAAGQMDLEAAHFNPLDWLDAGDPNLAENTMLLADALVVPSGGDSRFWDEEAKGLIFGLLLYLVTDDREKRTRHLGRLRDLLTLPAGPSEDPDDFTMIDLMFRMQGSDHALVRSSGNRFFQKEDRERSSVLSSAQAQTHFLDSPRIRESLSTSDFRFEDLKTTPLTVYLILPADRLNAFGRWLRLLIQQAITVNARNIEQKPEKPVLFMLDEMPALGHLSMVEQAYGLMAGFGIQLWGIVQDLSQLERIYGKSWQTFIGNSGVLQYFGSRDRMTAEYFSKLCGVTTVWTLSETIGRAVTSAVGGGSSTENWSTTTSNTGRNLAFPDELMTLHKSRQLLLVENHNPIAGDKVQWFDDPVLREKGTDIRTPQIETLPAPIPDEIADATQAEPEPNGG